MPVTAPVKIAMVEDNAINRNTFLQKMQGFAEMDIMLIACNGDDYLEQLKGLPQYKLPQVVFMDIEMPGLDGIETTRLSKALYPQVHIIMLTVFEDNDKLFDAIHSGATGYLLKHEPNTMLQAAVKEVLEYGGAPMSPAIARKTLQLLSSSSRPLQAAPASDTVWDTHLSDREKETLHHTVNGWDAKRIATQLNISVLTVRKHTANIYAKLHINSKAQVISLAHKNKWFG